MQCPAGQYDMLDWATLDPDLAADHHLEGNANPLYTYIDKDKFYWMKGPSGYPWDIQLVDDKNIYLWVTEQEWGDPDTFKKSHHNTNMPLMSRCASGGQPGSSVTSSDTTFEIVHKCNNGDLDNLGSMVNEVWGPNKMSFGGDIPDNTDTLILTYRYNCDRKFNRCDDREQFYLTQRYGLVRWDHSKWKDAAYSQDNFTVYNRVVHGGAPAPEFPCS